MLTSVGEQTPIPQGRILVADDEPSILRAYRRVLCSAGFQVDTAENGQLAVELFKKERYDLVLSDIAMPAMDGLELLRAVHELDPDMPVILATAGPALETAMRAVEYGALHYVAKPFDIELLRESVKSAVAHGRSARARRAALEQLGRPALDVDLRARFEAALLGLWMAFQPIVDPHSKTVYGYEALVRTREKSIPHPGALFDAAEKLGALHRLGRRIRDAVASSLSANDDFRVFVNLHPQDLLDEELFSTDSWLAQFAHRVVLEITERESLSNIGDVRAKMLALKAMGYKIAVDDLGAGYAGLSSFAALEPDVVKLDMSLVRGVDQSTTKQKMIQSLLEMCRTLGAVVVAEGVETAAERDILEGYRCDLLQGYLFGRPGPYVPEAKF